MKKLAFILVLTLAGCASAPPIERPQTHVVVKKQVQPCTCQPATPNQVVRKRWYDRFKVHPRLFH